MRATKATIRAVNRLTARWADALDGQTVYTAAGVWPLLAFLADGAAGAARAELEEALAVPADEAGSAARELLAGMAAIHGLDTAVGLWTSRTVELREAWEAGLPVEAHGVLTGDPEADRAALDGWAAERTGGLVERMPVVLEPRTVLVLATALALRTDWEAPFTGTVGLWPGGEDRAGLTRTESGLDSLAVARTRTGGAVTRVTVRGTNGIDVHLLLGDAEMTPGQVLTAGVDILTGEVAAVPGSGLPLGDPGPGLRLESVRTVQPEPPSLVLDTVEFTLDVDHDLLSHPEVFGLTTAADGAPGHFPGISAAPLALRSARQTATSTFSAEGFRAAAVTAMEAVWLSWEERPEPQHETVTARATFDRPFGFLTVHRDTHLALAAGWVSEPKPFREDAYDWPGEDPVAD
ncbi:serpin family protein [Streptomyces sp. NPDC048751]|uniref:serpin family protein n=1 Tax=Streptomyces sp. NPDC048751 TaxID=3365591 RepID=UPI003714DAC5